MVMPFPMILRQGGGAHPYLSAFKALGSQLPEWSRSGACTLIGNQGSSVRDPVQLCSAAAAAASPRPPVPEGSDGGSRCRCRRRCHCRLLLLPQSCGLPLPRGPWRGAGQSPSVRGPRPAGQRQLVAAVWDATSRGGGGALPPPWHRQAPRLGRVGRPQWGADIQLEAVAAPACGQGAKQLTSPAWVPSVVEAGLIAKGFCLQQENRKNFLPCPCNQPSSHPPPF